jgi:nucleotide-binding universal stress UspA family protein
MKKVMIALDYHTTAQKVAETGFTFARSLGAEVTLLHVISDPVYYSSSEYSPIMGFTGFLDASPFPTDTVEALKNASLSFLEKSREHLKDKNIKLRVEEGDLPKVILKVAKEIHADIIIMGSHGRRWLEEILIGSATEDVLHHTSIPLLIIPTKKQN